MSEDNDFTEEAEYLDKVATPGLDPGYCLHCGHPVQPLLVGHIHTETFSARCRAFTT